MTLSEAHYTNPYPPIKTQALAFCEAIELSVKHPHLFHYVSYSTTTGMYYVDRIGLSYSDPKVIAAFLNGNKTL